MRYAQNLALAGIISTVILDVTIATVLCTYLVRQEVEGRKYVCSMLLIYLEGSFLHTLSAEREGWLGEFSSSLSIPALHRALYQL